MPVWCKTPHDSYADVEKFIEIRIHIPRDANSSYEIEGTLHPYYCPSTLNIGNPDSVTLMSAIPTYEEARKQLDSFFMRQASA